MSGSPTTASSTKRGRALIRESQDPTGTNPALLPRAAGPARLRRVVSNAEVRLAFERFCAAIGRTVAPVDPVLPATLHAADGRSRGVELLTAVLPPSLFRQHSSLNPACRFPLSTPSSP